jgi:hypothetical protein
MSNILLYVDNKICTKGEAYTNYSGLFYPSTNKYQNYYTYSSPFKQLVNDRSIPGADVLSGVYVGSTFTTGQSGPLYINHYNGQVHFDSTQGSNKVSGNYSIKDFSVSMTSKSEGELLFETKYKLRPKVKQVITGLNPDQETYPIIYLKNMGGKNEPIAFGGMDNTVTNVRAVILADSAYKLDAACSILKDSSKDSFRIIKQSDLPFGALGLHPTGSFNYTGLNGSSSGNHIYIKETNVTNNIPKITQNTQGTDIHAGFIDFRLEAFRYPRV